MAYSVVSYEECYRKDVIRMLGAFWHYNEDLATSFFEWKYLNCPFSSSVSVALLVNSQRIVGMRGAGHIPLRISGSRKLAACVGDSWIDPEHRGKDQFGALTECLQQLLLRNGCDLVLNMSASEKVYKASLKNDWQEIAQPSTLSTQYSEDPWFSRDFTDFDHQFAQPQPFENGVIISSNQIFAEQVITLQKKSQHALDYDIDRDLKYLQWRYLRPDTNYRFLYLFENAKQESSALPPLKNWISICLPAQNKPGHLWIADYLYRDVSALALVLNKLVRTLNFRSINIQNTHEIADISNQLVSYGFNRASSNTKIQHVLQLSEHQELKESNGVSSKHLALKGHTLSHRAINLDGM